MVIVICNVPITNLPRDPTGGLFGLPFFLPADATLIDLLLLTDCCLSCLGIREGNKFNSSSSVIVISPF